MTRSGIMGLGMLAAMLGGGVRAEDAAKASGKIDDPARAGQPRGTGRAPAAGGTVATGRELSGTLVKAESTTLYLEHMGAIVPMRIDDQTRFSGEGVTSRRDLTEGQEIRASFKIRGTTNVADSIAVASTPAPSGGTGSGRAPPGRSEGLPPGHPPVPRDGDAADPPGQPPIPRDPGGSPPVDPGAPPVPKY